MSGSRVSYLAKPVQEARGRGSRQQSQELGPRWGLPPCPHWPGPLGPGQARGAPVPQALCVGGTSSTLFLLSRGGRRRPGRSGLCCCHSRGGCRTCPFPRRDMQCTGLCWGRAEGAAPGSVWALGFLRGPAWPSGRWRGPCLWSRDSGRLVARAASSLTKAGTWVFSPASARRPPRAPTHPCPLRARRYRRPEGRAGWSRPVLTRFPSACFLLPFTQLSETLANFLPAQVTVETERKKGPGKLRRQARGDSGRGGR